MISRYDFYRQVKKTKGCWNWKGTKTRTGYGVFTFNSERCQAHRTSYEFAYGPIPKGKFVLHKCDNPACVKPDHLFLGTQKDNVRDASEKGRLGRKLTALDALHIKISKESDKILAERYGISKGTVLDIKTWKTWKHVV